MFPLQQDRRIDRRLLLPRLRKSLSSHSLDVSQISSSPPFLSAAISRAVRGGRHLIWGVFINVDSIFCRRPIELVCFQTKLISTYPRLFLEIELGLSGTALWSHKARAFQLDGHFFPYIFRNDALCFPIEYWKTLFDRKAATPAKLHHVS